MCPLICYCTLQLIVTENVTDCWGQLRKFKGQHLLLIRLNTKHSETSLCLFFFFFKCQKKEDGSSWTLRKGTVWRRVLPTITPQTLSIQLSHCDFRWPKQHHWAIRQKVILLTQEESRLINLFLQKEFFFSYVFIQ